MVSIEKWLPLVFLGVAGVPDPVARQYISLVLNEFAMDTFAFQRTIKLNIEDGVTDYYFAEDFDDSIELVALMRYQRQRFSYTPSMPAMSCCMLGRDNWSDRYDPVQRMLRLAWRPSEDHPGGIELTLAVAPTPDAVVVDDTAWKLHSQAILEGVQAKLYALPNYPWTSLPAARMHSLAYAAHVNAAKTMSVMNLATGKVQLRRRGAL